MNLNALLLNNNIWAGQFLLMFNVFIQQKSQQVYAHLQ